MKELAVVTPLLGVKSESFIRRHMTELYPGNTCVVANDFKEKPEKPNDNLPIFLLKRYDINAQPFLKRTGKLLLQKTHILPQDIQSYELKKFLTKHQVKVMLSEYLDYSLNFIEIAQQLGIKFYAHAHGYDVSMRLQDKHWQKKYLALNDIEGVIAMSDYSKQRLIEIGIDEQKITVIPYGVHIPNITRQEKANEEEINIIAIGRMVSKKAPIFLLDAFRRATQILPNLKLNYVGDGPLYSAAWQFVKAFNLEKHVRLLGALPNEEVLELLKSSDMFIQHSITCPLTGDQEGLPVAILEALSYGIPVVSTRHTGIPEAIKDGENGFLVEEGDTSGMSEKIVALASDISLREKNGCAGKNNSRKKLFLGNRKRKAPSDHEFALRLKKITNLIRQKLC